MTEQVSSKNTKAQILAAYNQLYEKHERVQAQAKQLLAEKKALEDRIAGLGTVAGETTYTIDTILNGLGALRAGFGDAASALSAKLTAEATTLEALRRQVAARTRQLQELHGLTVTEDTLGKLIQEYKDKSAAYEDQASETREAFEREMSEQQTAWKEERQEHTRATKDQDNTLKKERQRSIQEYKYSLEMARKLDAEQYEQDTKKDLRELEAFVAAKEREWAAREQALAEREREYEDLKAQAEALPDELVVAIKRAEKEGTDLARRQAKVQDDLLAKEEEGSQRVAELNIQSLQETIDRQTAQIESLSAQIEAVIQQSQELATKAIEGASHETSFQSIREIALEQAKRQPKGQ